MTNDSIKAILKSAKKLNCSMLSLPGIVSEKKEIINSNKEFIDIYVTDSGLRKVVAKLLKDGHHARAVEEAFKYIDNLVKKIAKPTDNGLTGKKLMENVFSAALPLLKLNSGNTQSEKDEQLGYMQILSGCMVGIRNPRAHEHDWEDSEHRALQLIIFADHLITRIRDAEKTN